MGTPNDLSKVLQMNFERKVVLALAAHEACLQQIKRLTHVIGVCINKCQNGFDEIGPRPEAYEAHSVGDQIFGPMPWPNGSEEHMKILYDEKGYRKTHIWEAFQHREPNSCGYIAGLHTDEIGDYLAELGCVHCTRAWYFIQKRKEERRDLGHFRLSLRGLGKSALKKLDP
ncbi:MULTISPECIES: hypothetical protein [Pseudomonas]|uniref:hypothetical protein n=1 Tax=Pseudomonas TaxID=286 RepID=UPI000642332A|nr:MULTISPECIES: hypothetical protein [Pseudomonas]QXE10687.1 hypothetical protein GTQ41_17010 [Pseudomonas sp. AN-B15]